MLLLPLSFVFPQDLFFGVEALSFNEVGWWDLSCHCLHSKKDLKPFYDVWRRHRCKGMPFHASAHLVGLSVPHVLSRES